MNRIILNGNEIIIGGRKMIPMDISVLATMRSITIKGIKRSNFIGNVF